MNFKRLLPVYFARNLIFAFILIISIGLTLINFSGCQSHEKVIKIGNQAALSGDDKFFGDDQLISLSLAVSGLEGLIIKLI
jgi:hypothetical protein